EAFASLALFEAFASFASSFGSATLAGFRGFAGFASSFEAFASLPSFEAFAPIAPFGVPFGAATALVFGVSPSPTTFAARVGLAPLARDTGSGSFASFAREELLAGFALVSA